MGQKNEGLDTNSQDDMLILEGIKEAALQEEFTQIQRMIAEEQETERMLQMMEDDAEYQRQIERFHEEDGAQ